MSDNRYIQKFSKKIPASFRNLLQRDKGSSPTQDIEINPGGLSEEQRQEAKNMRDKINRLEEKMQSLNELKRREATTLLDIQTLERTINALKTEYLDFLEENDAILIRGKQLSPLEGKNVPESVRETRIDLSNTILEAEEIILREQKALENYDSELEILRENNKPGMKETMRLMDLVEDTRNGIQDTKKTIEETKIYLELLDVAINKEYERESRGQSLDKLNHIPDEYQELIEDRKILTELSKSTANLSASRCNASGFICGIDTKEDGYIYLITNEHVAEQKVKYARFSFVDKSLPCEDVHINKHNKEPDLALLRIKKSELTPDELQMIKPLRINLYPPKKGSKVFTVGNPGGFSISELGQFEGHSGIVTKVTSTTETKNFLDVASRIMKISDAKHIISEGGTTIGGSSGSPGCTLDERGELSVVSVHSGSMRRPLYSQNLNTAYKPSQDKSTPMGVPAKYIIEMLEKVEAEQGIKVPYEVAGQYVRHESSKSRDKSITQSTAF